MYEQIMIILPGDIINIHEKQADGWWVGELDSVVGIFPATYVEEIDWAYPARSIWLMLPRLIE